ncbi:hypothetical protein FRC03_007857 [Tulasnella sp. 419]|nr:hypothetical protein FRC03_007857 [Tulasnella sp. 419]
MTLRFPIALLLNFEITFLVEYTDVLLMARRHARFTCNYTTYDVRREQDVINPNSPSRSFVMVKAAAGKHPFWYARVLGIFHLDIVHKGLGTCEAKRIEVLWIRWMGEDPDYVGNDKKHRLHRVGYVPSNGPGAFGFLDPSLVIRGAHLIPAFAFGYTTELLPKSNWWDDEQHGDYTNYYVNQFVDRDMLMRYIGHGVGHSVNPLTAPSTTPIEDAEEELMEDIPSERITNLDGGDLGKGDDSAIRADESLENCNVVVEEQDDEREDLDRAEEDDEDDEAEEGEEGDEVNDEVVAEDEESEEEYTGNDGDEIYAY